MHTLVELSEVHLSQLGPEIRDLDQKWRPSRYGEPSGFFDAQTEDGGCDCALKVYDVDFCDVSGSRGKVTMTLLCSVPPTAR